MKCLNHTNDYKEEKLLNLSKAKNHFWYLHRNKAIKNLIEELREESPSILELGAGSGNISAYLSEKGYDIVASEFYQSGVDIIKSKGIKAFQFDLVNNSPLPQSNLKSYDIIILGDVIEHLDDPVMALKNARNFLRNGGYMLVTVPALSILWSNYDVFCKHKRRYSTLQLTEQLQEAGYMPIKVRCFMFLPGIILLIKRNIMGLFRQEGNRIFSNEIKINFIVNTVMKIFMAIEYSLQKFIYLPFGSSIYALASVKNEN